MELSIIPREAEFHGVSRIWVTFSEPAKSLWLNAKDLTIEKASITVNGRARDAKTRAEGEFLELEVEREIAPERPWWRSPYKGQLSDKTNSGLYRKNAGSDWYAYTTFTPIEARRAFPCFDEPGYKTPWRVILHVPVTDVAVSNSRIFPKPRNPPG